MARGLEYDCPDVPVLAWGRVESASAESYYPYGRNREFSFKEKVGAITKRKGKRCSGIRIGIHRLEVPNGVKGEVWWRKVGNGEGEETVITEWDV